MSVVAKTLIQSKFATAANEYTVGAGKTAIVDKLTALNTDAVDRTISIYIVPSGGAAGLSNVLVNAKTLTAGQFFECTEIKNHILGAGDVIRVVASVVDVIAIRASGREVS